MALIIYTYMEIYLIINSYSSITNVTCDQAQFHEFHNAAAQFDIIAHHLLHAHNLSQ